MSNASNGLGRTRKISARRSVTTKRNSDEEDFVPEPTTSNRPEVPSTINQRPRRQVKHKFIKTGNRRSLTDELYTTLIGPNSPSALALIPVVERLSDNVSNFAELLAAKESKSIESNTPTMSPKKSPADEPIAVEQSFAEPKTNSKEPTNRAQKTLGIRMRRRGGRQTRTSNNLVDTETIDAAPEANHAQIVLAPPEPANHVVEVIAMEDDSIVTIEEGEDRFQMDVSAFNDIASTVDVSGPVDFAEEVVIEETVETTEFNETSIVCDDSVAAVATVAADESDGEAVITEEVNDVIDVSDSLSFLNDSDDSDSKSVVDSQRLSLSSCPTHDAKKENDAIDIDENSGSIILVLPSDPLQESIAATEEITSSTFEPNLADDDTANDADVDEVPLNGPRRRSKRKSKSIAVDETPVKSEAVDSSSATPKPVDSQSVNSFGDLNLSAKTDSLIESDIKSEATAESSTLRQNNIFIKEITMSSSEETTQSESNDRPVASDSPLRAGGASQRPRREAAERINYSVRRNYMPKQSIKNDVESMDVVSESADTEVDVEAELEKSVIERPTIEPKFKFKKSEQMRTYQRRLKTKGTKKSSPSSSPPSSSTSVLSSASLSVQSSPKAEQTTPADQNVDTLPVDIERRIDSVPTVEPSNHHQTADDISTDSQLEPTAQKRRSAGRPRKSDTRRKPPAKAKNSIRNTATNVDASIETAEMVDVVEPKEQRLVSQPYTNESHEETQIVLVDVDVKTEVPIECTTTEEVTGKAPQPSLAEDELLPKVENLLISAVDPALQEAVNAMEADICKMEIVEEEEAKEAVELNGESERPTSPIPEDVTVAVATTDVVSIVCGNRMQVDSHDQTAIKEGKVYRQRRHASLCLCSISLLTKKFSIYFRIGRFDRNSMCHRAVTRRSKSVCGESEIAQRRNSRLDQCSACRRIDRDRRYQQSNAIRF